MKNKTLAVFVALAVTLTAWAAVPVVGSIINAKTGFQVNGGAPSGQALCGNGTVGVYSASCPIAAQTAASLASTPTNCSGATPMSQGIAANGNANCAAVPGVGGTLVDVTGSRSIGTTFTNSGSTAIYVSGYVTTTVGGDTSQVTCSVNGLAVWSQQANATVVGNHDAFACMVPPGGAYAIATNGTTSFTLGSWTEFTF